MNFVNFDENVIFKGILENKELAIPISGLFEETYFTTEEGRQCFRIIKSHLDEFKTIPQKDIIIGESKNENMKEFLDQIYSLDLDVAKNYDFIFEKANEYLKDRAVKQAILDSVDIIEKRKNVSEIRKLIEEALCKDLKVDLGTEYFNDMRARLERMFNASDNRIPTYFRAFDDFISGGFPPFTLSIFAAQVHGFKSNLLANMAARQVLNGHDVVLFTLEMSEDAFSQRFDSIFSLCDINRMYLFDAEKKKLIERLSKVKNNTNHGRLYIKEFPPGKASVREFNVYLRELKMRDIYPDIVLFDYVNLLKPEMSKIEDLYGKVKLIAEEARALSFIHEIPFVSVSQLNRSGAFEDLKSIDWNYISESVGLAATCDFMGILGRSEDEFVYESELHYKISKNRLGGRCGDLGKFYVDRRNLKMYDSTELDLWLSDARISEDERNLYGEGE